uniref:NIDO domain-containing protein n=1 Tax=Cyprinus carpio TaxID=7962 RepID=A0A8C1YPY6_CYPCA
MESLYFFYNHHDVLSLTMSLMTALLPFGVEDTLNPVLDDGSSNAISLHQPFKYFGRTYNQIFVNNNGHLTFTEPLYSYNPILKSERDLIAPLWTDLDNRRGGTISYREDTSNAVLAQVTAAVNQYFPNIPFAATSAFVATWNRVPFYNGGGVVTFQVVLAYNFQRSFILINYGNIPATTQNWLAGYITEDSLHSYTIPVTKAPELSSSSNINVNGQWSFNVDGSPKLPTRFIDLEEANIVKYIADNRSSEAIKLQQPFKYFGRIYNQIFVSIQFSSSLYVTIYTIYLFKMIFKHLMKKIVSYFR